ncbi:hypothetical protein QTP88_023763 [Uroleucon formosanum]
MVITTTSSRPFEKIFMDSVGPFPKSHKGNIFILTLQDDLSKFAWAVPMINHEANTVAYHFVTQFVCLHGLPKSLVTDCGTEFLSHVFKEVCQLLKIKQTSTTPYHPQNPQNWDTYVLFAMFCHNSTVHTATKFQPYQLVYGNEITVPHSFTRDPEPQYNYEDYYFEMKKQMQEAHKLARAELLESKHKSKERYDKLIAPLNLAEGDRVLIQDKARKGKLAPKWLGPYPIVEIQPDSPNVTILKKTKPVKNQQGIYYESHGVARLSHVSWELVISLDVQLLISKYHVIMAHYQATMTICENMKNRFGNVEIEEICSLFIQQFSRATLPYLNEIEANHKRLMLAINNDDNRVRRGLGHTFRRMANVLYGVCSKIDVEFIINQITELNRSKVPSKSNIPEKIRFLQAEVNHSTQQLELQQQKVEQNLQYLQAQTNLTIQNLNKSAFRTKVLEQSLLFELVLNKYAYETQNLISIINTALDGKIHTSVFTPQHIIKELLEIKVDLPIGNTFPLEVDIESLNEILRISEKNILFKDNYLIYVIEIPLITSEEYSIYHPIPLPIPHSEQTIFLVDPEIDYLGVSRDNENFIALDNAKWEECTTLKPYTVCRGNQHVQHCAESDVCVVSLLVNNQFNPDHCKFKFVSLKAPIWHQLVQTNSWIYYTQQEVGTITCTNPTENSKIEIEGVGRITTPPFCKINLRNSILFSNNKASRDIHSDIIPQNSKNEPLHTLADIVKTIIPQNLTNKIPIQNLNQLTNKAVELNELSHTLAEPSLIFNINIHVIVIYIIVILTILTTSILSFSLRKNVTKIYNPEIPEA